MAQSSSDIDRLVQEFITAWQLGTPLALADFVNRAPKELRARLAEALLPIDRQYRNPGGEVISDNDHTALLAAPRLSPTMSEDTRQVSPQAIEPGEGLDLESGEKARLPTVAAIAGGKTVLIGNYKLLQKLGEGGMGEVWMAEQERPVRRRVALKLIKSGLDNKQIIARFEAERQALAMMDHQNIAKVLDAGTMPDGLPYFVMELVRGIPFTKYCDQNKLSIDARLELFIPVCQAVQHAHQKGIIHRDLKPSNVLVCLYDGMPVPKVIDFGLAKALEQQTRLTDKTMFTEFGQIVGTVQYMSPEQAELNQLDVDTRTDIYSLGVMLYELLAGSTPIEVDSLRKNAILQVLATIREQEPPRPSARLSSATDDAASGISAQRQIDASRLKQILKGELDWIVMKSIEKDRTRRYDTAVGLANDLNNYLRGEVVTARPPTLGYRATKYVRRNKGLVAALSSVAVALLAGFIGIGWFAFKAYEARMVADAKAAEVMVEKQLVEVEREIAKAQARRADLEAIKALEAKQIAQQESERSATEAQKARIAEKAAATEAQNAQTAQKAAATEAQSALRAEQAAELALEKSEATLARSNYSLAVARWNEGRVGEAQDLLRRVPTKYRNLEWHLDNRAFEGSSITLYGHDEPISDVSFNSDGTRLISGSFDGTLKLWDAETGRELQTLVGNRNYVNKVAFRPDGKQIASLARDIELWDANSGEQLRILKHSGGVASAAYSPDGKRIVSGNIDGTLKLWDVATGNELRTWDWDTTELKWRSPIVTVGYSPDGMRILSASDMVKIKLWDAETGQELQSFSLNYYPIHKVRFSPEGHRILLTVQLSDSKAETLKLLDADTGQELRSFAGHSLAIHCVAFSPDGTKIVSGSEDKTLKLWDIETGEELRRFKGHAGPVRSVAFSPDGMRIVSASEDQTLKIWDIETGGDGRKIVNHFKPVRFMRLSPDGTFIVSASDDNTMKLWDAITGKELLTFAGHSGKVHGIAFSPDSKQIISGSEDRTLKLWDVATSQELRTISRNVDSLGSLAFSPDGKRIVSSGRQNRASPGIPKLWDVETGREVWTFKEEASIACFSPDGTLIVSANVDELTVWNAETGEERSKMKMHQLGRISSLAFSPDGMKIVSGCDDAKVRLWDIATGKLLKELAGHESGITCVAFSPDGTRIIAGGGDYTFNIEREMRMFRKNMSFGDFRLRVWDSETGDELRAFEGHSSDVTGVMFSADGTRMVSGSTDKTMALWTVETVETEQELRTISLGDVEAIESLGFDNKTGTHIVATLFDGESIAWDPNSGERIKETSELKLEEPGNERSPFSRWISPDGRWKIRPPSNGGDVIVEDREFKNTPREKARRALFASPKPDRHRSEAQAALEKSDGFAAAFHLAWLLKIEAETDHDRRNLRESADYTTLKTAYSKLTKSQQSCIRPLIEQLMAVVTAEKEK